VEVGAGRGRVGPKSSRRKRLSASCRGGSFVNAVAGRVMHLLSSDVRGLRSSTLEEEYALISICINCGRGIVMIMRPPGLDIPGVAFRVSRLASRADRSASRSAPLALSTRRTKYVGQARTRNNAEPRPTETTVPDIFMRIGRAKVRSGINVASHSRGAANFFPSLSHPTTWASQL
jgi:hypothetical protein